MTFKTGAWGEQAQERSQKRLGYFKDYQRKKGKTYNTSHISSSPTYKKEWEIKKRLKLLEFMGGKCIKCGFSDVRALQIDHINGDGYKDKKSGPSYWGKVYKSLEANEGKYQLLCANCNFIKRIENNECRKRLN